MSDPLQALKAATGKEITESVNDMPQIPAVPATDNSAVSNFLTSVKRWLEKAGGEAGFVSLRKLAGYGVVTQNPDGSFTGSAPDMAVPPAPTGLSVSGAMTNVIVEWDDPIAIYGNHSHTEIWASGTSSFSVAMLVGESSGFVFTHAIGPAQTRYYWIRFISTAGVAGPYNDVSGAMAQTAIDPAYMLTVLTGQLTESQLYSTLTSRIALIDGTSALTGSVNQRIATTEGALNDRVDTLQAQVGDLLATPPYDNATAYTTGDLVIYSGGMYQAKSATTGNLPTNTTYWTKIGDYASLGDAVAAHTAQITTLTTADTTEATARETLATQLRGSYTGTDASAVTTGIIASERATRISAEGVIASSVTTLTSRFENAQGGMNLLPNAGFEVNDGSLPTGWGVYSGEATTALIVDGPDQFKAVRLSWTGANPGVKGLYLISPFAGGFRTGQDYIIAMRVRAANAASVGEQFYVTFGTVAWTSIEYLKSPTLVQTEWRWIIARVRASKTGELYTSVLSNDGVVSGSIEISQPIVHEGTEFGGFNLGKDAALQASIIQEADTRANAITAEATTRNNLAVQLRGSYTGTDLASVSTGLIASERQARVSAVEAVVNSMDILSAAVGNNSTAISNEVNARTTLTDAHGSSITALQASVSGGTNLLRNPGFDVDVAGWSLGGGEQVPADDDGTISRNLAAPTWKPAGINTVGIVRIDTPTGVKDFLQSELVPVTANGRYCFSAYLAGHRCTTEIYLAIYDKDSNGLTSPESGFVSSSGGVSLSDWARAFGFVTIPSNGAFASLLVRQSAASGSYPYSWVCRPMLEEAKTIQTAPSPWSDSAIGLSAAITNERTVSASERDALASEIDTLEARLTGAGDVATAIVQAQSTATTGVTNAATAQTAANNAASAAGTAQSTANSKVKTFFQASTPTGETAGDLWVDTDDNNRIYRWSGSAWDDAHDARITATASQVTTLQTTVGGHTTSIETNATSIDGLEGKYTVKIDNNGYVTGYGLASTENNGVPTSEFTVVADKFSIAPVATSSSAADGSPFFCLTTPTTINGVVIPAGVYMKSAFIHDATITQAKIQDLAVDNAKIANSTIMAAKIANAQINNAHIDRASVNRLKVAQADIEDLAVNFAKIANGTITHAKMDSLSVGTAQIQDLSVGSIKIAGNAVTISQTTSLNITASAYDTWYNSYTSSPIWAYPSQTPQSVLVVLTLRLDVVTTGSPNFAYMNGYMDVLIKRNGVAASDKTRAFFTAVSGSVGASDGAVSLVFIDTNPGYNPYYEAFVPNNNSASDLSAYGGNAISATLKLSAITTIK